MNGPYTCEMLRNLGDTYEKLKYVNQAVEWFTQELLKEVVRINTHITNKVYIQFREPPPKYQTTISFNVMHNHLGMFHYVNDHKVQMYSQDVVEKLRERFPDIKMKLKSYPGFNEIKFDWSEN